MMLLYLTCRLTYAPLARGWLSVPLATIERVFPLKHECQMSAIRFHTIRYEVYQIIAWRGQLTLQVDLATSPPNQSPRDSHPEEHKTPMGYLQQRDSPCRHHFEC